MNTNLPPTIAPADASFKTLCKMGRSSYEAGHFWILTDGHTVSLHEQKLGEKPKQQIHIPVEDFNKLARWYLRPQRVKR